MNEIFEKLKFVLIEQILSVGTDEIVPETTFKEDLGLDESDMMDLCNAVADEFKIDVLYQEFFKLVTVQDVADYVKGKVSY